jgi:DNA mismatch repair ATPase MutL
MSYSDHDVDDDGGGLEVFFDEVKTQVKDFKKAVHKFSTADKNNKKKLSDNVDKAQKSAQEAISIFKTELKQADESDRRNYEKEFKKQQDQYNDIVTQLKELRENKPAPEEKKPKKEEKVVDNTKKKDELFGKEPQKTFLGANNNEEDEDEEVKPKKKKKKDKGGQQEHVQELDDVLNIQNETTEIMRGMLRDGEEIIITGMAAQEKLQQQTEKLVGIQKELDELGDGLKRARKELNAFMRGLACDHCMGKIIIAFIIILALGVVAIIVLRSVKPDIFSPSTVSTPAPTPASTSSPTA